MRALLIFSLAAIGLLAASSAPANSGCTPGPYVVYFDRNATTMEPNGKEIVDNLVENHSTCPEAEMVIDGYSAGTETNELSGQRALAIGLMVIERKVPKDKVYLRALGVPKDPRLSRPPAGWSEDARVEIILRPSS